MRIALLADIHANLEALSACLVDAAGRGIDEWVFLGDIVGYGADPVACTAIVRELCEKGAKAIKGNHDEAACGTSRMRLNPNAAAAAAWTASMLGRDDKAFLASLPLEIAHGPRLFVHASAQSPQDWIYVHGLDEAIESLTATAAQVTVVGHVHIPALYHMAVTGKVMAYTPSSDMAIPLPSQRRWLAVMGAVGQPRDGNPAAAYGVLDTERSELAYIRVPYDVETAAQKIRQAGLPDMLWRRLSAGR